MFSETAGIEVALPSASMHYQEAMSRYGNGQAGHPLRFRTG